MNTRGKKAKANNVRKGSAAKGDYGKQAKKTAEGRNTGRVSAHINTAGQLLKKLDLLDDANEYVTYSSAIPGLVRAMPYHEEYQHYVGNRLYDFRLADHSLFQFKEHGPTDISYCYYQAPFEVQTYKEYVAEVVNGDMDMVEELGDMLQEDYEQVVSTSPFRRGISPIRYDYTPHQYEAGIHPAAHVHIGIVNEIRLCANRLMLPTSFVLFVLRQLYPDHWRRFLRMDNASSICRAVREDLALIDSKYNGDLDRLQLVLE